MAPILSVLPSSFYGTGNITTQLPSRVQITTDQNVQLGSRFNCSDQVEMLFPSRFQATGNLSNSPLLLPSRFCGSGLAPEIGVDDLGTYEWTITPAQPEPQRGS